MDKTKKQFKNAMRAIYDSKKDRGHLKQKLQKVEKEKRKVCNAFMDAAIFCEPYNKKCSEETNLTAKYAEFSEPVLSSRHDTYYRQLMEEE